MTRIDLAKRVQRPSGKPVVLANIATTQAQASDLFALYNKIVISWREGAPAIIAQYERTLAQLVTDSPSDTTAAIDDIDAQIRRLVIMLSPDLRRWALNVERVHRGKWVSNVMSATSVDLSTILSPDDMNDTVEASLNWNTALIRDVAEETRRRIANAVFAGFQRRAPASEIAREIRESVGMARARSLRIAADQTVKLGSRLNQARQEQAGLTSFKWRHSGKLHPRSWHQARNGQVYPWEGSGIPPSDMPGVPPFCGCTAQGVVTFEDDEPTA
jgi:SPP1 gp7 family putative phage head morphogenesis protein